MASSRKWQRAIALDVDAKGFIGFCCKKMEYVSHSIVGLTLATIKQGYTQ